MSLSFELLGTDGMARRGRIGTAHGTVETPAFMPLGTGGTVKAMLPQSVAETGAEIVLGNTFHLMLRPGAERVAAQGGLHKFMNWPRPILTDSGGFQVMSLKDLRKLDPDGVTFRSPFDGSEHRLTPERSIEIQHLLDTNITMSFDECTSWPVEQDAAAFSMRLSMKWAERGKRAFADRPGYGLFGIVQGSVFPDLRAESVKALTDIGFDGYAVGGLAVGEGQQAMFGVLDVTTPMLPADRPRYLMGVGRPADIVGAVKRGIDMFDCVLPTRGGRTAQAFTRRGELNSAQRPPSRRPSADRRAVRLSRLPASQPRLSASPDPRRGDSRGDASDVAQSALLPGHHARPQGRHRKRFARSLDRRIRGRTRPRRHTAIVTERA